MRRLLPVLALILILPVLALQVCGTEASDVAITGTVYPDGSCHISIAADVRVAQDGELTFPIPAQAKDVTLNGSRARTTRDDNARYVELSGLSAGLGRNLAFTVAYTLPSQLHTTDTGLLQLQLPLLSGFAYPINKLSFTVNLPGSITTEPSFISGYHHASIEQDLSFRVSGSTVTGKSVDVIKDHETLSMLLTVEETMFPQVSEDHSAIAADDWAIGIACVLALLYWALFLRFLPPVGRKSSTVPEGFTAGQMCTGLTLTGADLSAMVLSWAQLGYILIQADRYGRVLLHKRMEMGNERTEEERRRFQKLFAKKELVDCSSAYYALQCKAAQTVNMSGRTLAHPRSGNPKIFLGLCSAVGLFAGLSLALALGGSAVGRWLLGIVLVPAGAVSCWYMLGWAKGLLLRQSGEIRLWLILGSVWLILSVLAGQLHIGATVLAVTLLGGFMGTYGGRRTEAGRQTFGQIIGLRRFLRNAPKSHLEHACGEDPDYFFTLAPYALALGVDRPFARRFGSQQLDRCPYLTTGMDGHRTAAEWNELMRRTLNTMDRRAKGLSTERLRRIFRA